MAVKELDVAPAAIVKEAGMVSAALLSDRLMVLPAGGAAWFRVTVQEEDAPEFTLKGLHARVETRTGATRLNPAL